MKEFKAESKKLLDLVINSIYTNKDVFLRELISNASDAYDKLQLAQASEDIGTEQGNVHEIRISFDIAKRTITISDNGIGMSATELETNLGTIAHSASLEVKSGEQAQSSDDVDIIGQFGVGFYSCFMVADHVDVISRAHESSEANRWSSDGLEGFSISPDTRALNGTDIILHLRADTDDFDYSKFLSHSALSELVKRYSNYIRYPITMELTRKQEIPQSDKKRSQEPLFEDCTEVVTLNSMTPIWTRPKSDVPQSEYDTFYMDEFDDKKPPLRTISMHARGGKNCDVLLFIPSEPPADFFSSEFKKGLELYSSNVMIMERCPELLSEAFGFIRGVVDSPDISLNLSRETLQQDQFLKAIASQIRIRVKAELEDMRDNERDLYEEFFGEFGRIFKFAIYATFGAQNAELEDLLMYFTANKERPSTLREYKDNMPDNQPCIFYASGSEAAERLEASPAVTAVTSKGFDVLLCTDSIDEFALMTLREYDSVPIKNVAADDLMLESEQELEAISHINNECSRLFSFIAKSLGDKVVEVTASTRLNEVPACISAKGPVSLGMEKYFSTAASDSGAPRAQHVFELNLHHRIFKTITDAYERGDESLVARYAIILYSQALLAEGLPIDDLASYSKAIYDLM